MLGTAVFENIWLLRRSMRQYLERRDVLRFPALRSLIVRIVFSYALLNSCLPFAPCIPMLPFHAVLSAAR